MDVPSGTVRGSKQRSGVDRGWTCRCPDNVVTGLREDGSSKSIPSDRTVKFLVLRESREDRDSNPRFRPCGAVSLRCARIHSQPCDHDFLREGSLMTSIQDRLSDLGIILPDPPKPVASYVPARRSGVLLHVSGQLPFRGGELLATGPVPSSVSLETAVEDPAAYGASSAERRPSTCVAVG